MTKRLLCRTKTIPCPLVRLWHSVFPPHCWLCLSWNWLFCQFGEKVTFTGWLSFFFHSQGNIDIFAESSTTLESETVGIIIGYLFGAAASVSLVGIAKSTIGRLRPHFLDVCKPDFSQIECGTFQRPNYITEYHCFGNEELFPSKVLLILNFYNFLNWKCLSLFRMREILLYVEPQTAFIPVILRLLSKQPLFSSYTYTLDWFWARKNQAF